MLKISGGILQGTHIPVLICPYEGHGNELLRVSNATFDTKNRVCYFPGLPPFVNDTLRDLELLFPDKHTFSASANALLATCKDMVDKYDRQWVRPDFKLKTIPYQHQWASMLYAIYHPRCGLLLGCGLGKSKVAIDVINYLDYKTLILMPASLISNWVREFEVHSIKDYKIMRLDDATAKKKKDKLANVGDTDIMLVGYETAANYQELIFKNFDYKMIIADESHRIKGSKSQRTHAAVALAAKANRRILMSGTMVLNSPEDLYSQLCFLSPQILNTDYYSFLDRYITYAPGQVRIKTGVKNLDNLNRIVRAHTVRYTKDACLDLPERTIINHYIDPSKEQRDWIKEILSDKTLFFEDGSVMVKEHRVVALTKLSQITGGFLYVSRKDPNICTGCPHVMACVEEKIKPYTRGCAVEKKPPDNKVIRLDTNPKLAHMAELLKDILSDDTNKVIIWAKAVEELAIISEYLTKEGIGFAQIKTDAAKDSAPFMSDPSCRVLIGNISVGIGFTANVANYVIYYSISFSLEHYSQSIDRNHRIGQKRNVTVYQLVVNESIDEQVINAIECKQDVVESLLTSMRCVSCKHFKKCSAEGIKQYERGCVFSKSIKKQTINVDHLEQQRN